jgi:CheY-like chemotaxis protein
MAGLRILIIDDERAILETLSLALELTGEVEVSTLQDVTQWQDRVLRFKPDIILVDYRMPAMNGDVFIEALGAAGLRSAIKCVGLFSATPFSQADLQRVGADVFFEKPFEIENLLFRIKEAAHSGESHAAA